MQDTSARILEESNIRVYDGTKKPEFKVHVNPHRERINEIESTIDALMDIRLSLGVKKIISPTIKKAELLKIINNTKEKITNNEVKKEIDKVFEEYLPSKTLKPNIPSAKDIWNNTSQDVSRLGVESKIDEALNDAFEDNAAEKGVSMVKKDRHFKNSSDDLSNTVQ